MVKLFSLLPAPPPPPALKQTPNPLYFELLFNSVAVRSAFSLTEIGPLRFADDFSLSENFIMNLAFFRAGSFLYLTMRA